MATETNKGKKGKRNMNNTIKVVIKEPGKDFCEAYMLNELKAFQSKVGGYIEAVPLTNRMIMIVNEEGKIRGLQPNFDLYGTDTVVGTALFCGVDGEEFSDVPLSLPVIRAMFPDCYSKAGEQNA